MSGQIETKQNIEERKPQKEQFSVARPPTYTKTYATNTLVTTTDSDIRIELFNEKFKVENGWIFQSEGLVILTKQAAKKLLISLKDTIEKEEKANGEIKVSEERMNFNFLIPR